MKGYAKPIMSKAGKYVEKQLLTGKKVIARVSTKPSPFWKPNPKIWFLQLEAQFRNAAITADQTKYDNVVSYNEAEFFLSQNSDILNNPPKDDKYILIKDRLISIFADTETQKTQKLLTEVELGDKTPFQLLYEMKNLSTVKKSEPFLKTLLLQQLQVEMLSILSISVDDLSKLVTMANKKLYKRQFSVHQLFRPRSRSNSINRRSNREHSICNYHSRFDDKATKYIKPCNCPNKMNNQTQEN
ncbi:uncharacterized protein NPIL_320371 [Nephila pilipes]|uniref:DUF7041 domain-containing protein n=1 Tax=Nephila pilipes TaxID=299642 RepID=A0A8X6TZ08_NEPPI|nr:uncharacterized protein NPIL_320371 [Nephila pilipes]